MAALPVRNVIGFSFTPIPSVQGGFFNPLFWTVVAPLPDFFIGAHAAALGVPIITRDVTRYQTYFPGVSLISP